MHRWTMAARKGQGKKKFKIAALILNPSLFDSSGAGLIYTSWESALVFILEKTQFCPNKQFARPTWLI